MIAEIQITGPDPADSSGTSLSTEAAATSSSPAAPEPNRSVPAVPVSPAPAPKPKKSHKKAEPDFTIVRLPDDLRATVVQMLRDGASDAQIIDAARQANHEITPASLAAYRKGPYKAWLKAQACLGELAVNHEFATQLLKSHPGTALQEAIAQVAAAHICDFLVHVDQKTLKKNLGHNPTNYLRLITALTRLGDAGLKYERYRLQVAEFKSRIQTVLSRSDEKGLSPEIRELIEKEISLL